MGLSPLKNVVRCPQCGSSDVVYSCEPKCCYNHVCAECRSTFELNTQKTGKTDGRLLEIEAPDSTEATTCCASCESLRVTVIKSDEEETLLACGNCHAVSRLVIEEFVPGEF